ncbi:MAG TPA: sulfite exporter TauE/SafE family protein [Streptosporangiaceae bacterium]|jgi:uncharacterized membrane protein YfcA|nr:sulfite exporter TauE/SafE family protein [Streptosporangiaceae bacterium]
MLALVLVAIPVGLFIGAVGIGGVVLPPALAQIGGLDVHAATGTSSWCFLFTGAVGALAYARQAEMPWRFACWLSLGAAPAAAVGALVNTVIPAAVLWLALGAITMGSGVHHLFGRNSPAGTLTQLAAKRAVVTGAGVGFGSALTGTGGPVLLVPVLLVLGIAPLTAVAASQAIQLPLGGFAALGYASAGSVHFRLGTLLGVMAAVGVVLGALIAARLRPRILDRAVASALVAVGLFLLVMPFLPIDQQ